MNAYLLVIFVYAALLVGLGLLITRRVKQVGDFFVAGRSLGPGLLFTTLLAANIGAGSTVGVTGLGYHFGLSAWWWIGASAMGSLILAYTVGPKVWQVSQKYNLYTVGDYLDHRYSQYFRLAIGAMMLVGTIALFAGQLIGIAWILEVVAGLPKFSGVIFGAVVVSLYFAAGGLLSSAIVNIVELGVILLGFLVALPFALNHVGGWTGLQQAAAQHLTSPEQTSQFFSFTGMGLKGILGYLLLLTPAFIISPGLIQKIYGAKDKKTVVQGTVWNGIIQLLFAFIPVILGMCAFAAFPDLSKQELALPMVMKELMPFWVGCLALAAIFAAEVSTADAVLFMLTTSFTKDLYGRFLKPDVSDREMLLVSRTASLIFGALGIMMALYLPSIIAALTIFYSLMTVSLTAPLLFGLYSQRAKTIHAFASAALGIITTLLVNHFTGGKGVGIFTSQALGILTSLGIMLLAVWLLPAKKDGGV